MIISEISRENAILLGSATLLLQTMEECGELVKAVSKYNRTMGIGQKTEITYSEALDKLCEELSDVSICIEQLVYMLGLEDSVKEKREKAFEKVYRRYHDHI